MDKEIFGYLLRRSLGLIFEEFFYWELGMALKKQRVKELKKERKYEIKKVLLSRFRKNLGPTLRNTTTQKQPQVPRYRFSA